MMQMKICDFVSGLYELKVNKLFFPNEMEGIKLDLRIE